MQRNIVKLIFIGKPGGKLVKGAPGSYKQGEIVNGPDTWAEDFPKIWKLAEGPVELVVPDMGDDDNVYDPWSYSDEEVEETVSVPEEILEESPEPVVGLSDVPTNEEDRLKELTKQYNATPGQFFLDPERGVITDPENIPELPREAIKGRLKDAGVPFNERARTGTLRKLLQEHGLEG